MIISGEKALRVINIVRTKNYCGRKLKLNFEGKQVCEISKIPSRKMMLLKNFIEYRRSCLFLFSILFVSLFFIDSCQADVGTAAQYIPPYLPTMCYGNDASEFPSSNLFAAAGDGIWDNGASCGRQYLVRCISATQPGTCVPDQTIQIKIVDYAPLATSSPTAYGTTIVLSQTAFGIIANSSAIAINVEFQQI